MIQSIIASYFLKIGKRRKSSSQLLFKKRGFVAIPAKIWEDSKYDYKLISKNRGREGK